MKPSNTITICRETFTLSQQALADYLQVSRSLLNMAERGERELPLPAFMRLTQLISSYDPSTPAPVPPERSRPARQKRLEQLRSQEKELSWQLTTRTQQLTAMEASYQRALCQVQAYQKIRQQLTNDSNPADKGQLLWLDIREEEVWKRADKDSPEARMPLRAEISALQASLRKNEQLITELLATEESGE